MGGQTEATGSSLSTKNRLVMLNTIFTKVFGSRNERILKRMGRVVKKINAQSYITSLFIALSESAYSHSNKDLSILVKNSQTAGGLNEQAVRSLRKLKFYSSTDKILNEILKRLKK